jgi:hypothetical protein
MFAEKLFNLLYVEGNLERHFVEFANVLVEINADKWTTATYFQFIMYPSEFMFMKPSVTIDAAEMCAFELNYKSELNWLTYNSLMRFSRYLNTELKDLNPKDMIDIQTFIWCIAQETY